MSAPAQPGARVRLRVGGGLFNRLDEARPQPAANVGDGATILMYSDRRAGTIIEATEKRIVVQLDHARRVDTNGMSESQTYEFTPDPNGATYVFTKRRNGRFVQEGYPSKSPGTSLMVGHRSQYHDYSF